MVTGLVLQGLLSYTVQSAGQLMTARIRSDLFDHALGLDLRFHLRTPVGLLLTRLTSDVGGKWPKCLATAPAACWRSWWRCW